MRDYIGVALLALVFFGFIFGSIAFNTAQETSRHNACVEAGGEYIAMRGDEFKCDVP